MMTLLINRFDVTGNIQGGGQVFSPLNNAGNSSTAITISWNDSNVQYVTMTGNCTFTFSNPQSGAIYRLILKQDATGTRLATWPATVSWPGGTAPTLSTTAADLDIITFVYDGVSTKYHGVGFTKDLT